MAPHRRTQSARPLGLEELFFQRAPLLVCLANLEGRFTALGGAWEATLGWSEKELMARRFLEFIHPDDLPATQVEIERLALGEATIRFRNRYRSKAGSWVVLQWDAQVRDEGTIFAVAQDVTASVARDLELERRNGVLEMVADLQRSYIQHGWSSLPFNEMLKALLVLSESAFGFFAFRPTAPGEFHNLAIEGFSSRVAEVSRFEEFWVEHPDAPWMSVVSSCEPVMRSTPADVIRTPFPVPVTSFLGLPILGNGGVIGILALFNRPEGFDQDWVVLLMSLCSAITPLHGLQCGLERESHLRSEVHRWSHLFTAAIESTGVCVIATDLQGRISYMNPTAQRMLGATLPEQAISVNLAAFHDQAELQDARKAFMLAQGHSPQNDFEVLVLGALEGSVRREWTYVSLTGPRYPMTVTLSPLRERDGEVTGWVVVASELSGLRAAQAEHLRAAQLEGQLEVLRRREIEAAKISEAYEYVSASRSLREALGVISAFLPTIFGAAAPSLLIPRSASRVEPRLGDLSEAEAITVEAHDCWGLKTGQLFVSEAGSLRCTHILDDQSTWACAPLADGQRTVAVLSTLLPEESDHGSDGVEQERHRRLSSLADQARQFSSVLANLRLRKTLEEQATRDPLTGAINRRQLDHELRITMHRHQKTKSPFALMVLDVDHFKRINDDFGHERGDRVLAGLGALLLKRLRTTDVVARVGGEEFVVLLREAAEQDALELANSLRESIEIAHLAGEGVPCTCSIGLVHVKELQAPLEDLLRLADQALYAAKAAGRNRVVFLGDPPDVPVALPSPVEPVVALRPAGVPAAASSMNIEV
jgi:diguanylate cyclase (GGDEF)-like protein/PAS domain S-box-containing protein